MTAEVGVLNRLGVALAADSAVTLGPGTSKIYTSAEKLFQLTTNAPVGIMVYGSADFLAVPWETIIKIYRDKLGSKVFNTIQEYADDFLDYIRKDRALFPASFQEDFVGALAYVSYSRLRKDFEDRLITELQKRRLTEKEIKELFSDLLSKQIDNAKKEKFLDTLNDSYKKGLRNKYKIIIAQMKKDVFENFPISSGISHRLSTLVFERLIRRGSVVNDSGIVIAGFGRDEHFPILVELVLCGMASNQLLFFQNNKVIIGRGELTSAIVPFAQKDMVMTFIKGIDPYLHAMIKQSTISLFTGMARTIIDNVMKKYPQYGTKLEQIAIKNLRILLKKLHGLWDNEIHDVYSGPVAEIVSSLPKDELAAIAESLVNLTKFKRRVSNQQETVGGPIDVAIITKGDGFIWVKRKHYFKVELNPKFLARLYGGSK